jgi:hypothetical protein
MSTLPSIRKQKGFRFLGSLFLFTVLVGYVGKKRHLTSSLDSGGKLSLVKSAVAGNSSGENLCSLGNELSELRNILVVDAVNLILTEDANLLSSVVLTVCGTLSIVSIHYDIHKPFRLTISILLPRQ